MGMVLRIVVHILAFSLLASRPLRGGIHLYFKKVFKNTKNLPDNCETNDAAVYYEILDIFLDKQTK